MNLFCADNLQLSDFVKNNDTDDPCLICPYPGRRRRYNQSRSTPPLRRFSLRNVLLRVDQMRMLSLDTTVDAKTMTEALAIIHCGARIDANNFKFMLAPSRPEPLTLPTFIQPTSGDTVFGFLASIAVVLFRRTRSGSERLRSFFQEQYILSKARQWGG